MATTISHNCELNHDSNINIDPFYVEVQILKSFSLRVKVRLMGPSPSSSLFGIVFLE